MSRQITDQELAWTESQPVIGNPCMTRLRVALTKSGLPPVELAMEGDGEGLRFRLRRTAGLVELDREHVLRLLISIMRRAGFAVGYSEVAVVGVDDEFVDGFSYVAPLSQLFYYGPPLVEP
jgi:hypothetical protein